MSEDNEGELGLGTEELQQGQGGRGHGKRGAFSAHQRAATSSPWNMHRHPKTRSSAR